MGRKDFLDTEFLSCQHGRSVDSLTMHADASAGGDEAFAIMERVLKLWQAEVRFAWRVLEIGWTGDFLFEGKVRALVTAVLLRPAWLDAFDLDAETQPRDREFGKIEDGVGAGEWTPLSDRMAAGKPISWNRCSKAAMARSSRTVTLSILNLPRTLSRS